MTKTDRIARDTAPLLALAAACACAMATASLAAPAPASPPASSPAGKLVTTLSLNGAGPYYTLRLPIALESESARADLGDLRVRNAAGETMPLAWVPQPATLDLVQHAPVTLYKVPAAMSAASAVAAGTTASAAAGTAQETPQSWIVDTRDAESDLVRLDLTLAAGAQGIFGLRIEASDDLQRWRLVQPQAQVVQLQQLPVVGGGGGAGNAGDAKGGAHLMSTGIELDGIPARYLRLTATSAGAAPPLADATVTRTRRQATTAPLEWSAPIAPAACEVNHCDYPLPRNLTVDALQIDLSDADTVGQVVVLGRVEERYAPVQHRHLLRGSLHALHLKQERAPPELGDVFWDTLATENVYWLTQAASAPDLHSPPLRLAGQRWEMLRLSTAGDIGQLGHAPPTLRVGARPRVLVFLARGAGPFHLDRAGAADVQPAMTMAQLMPTHAASDPLPADSATPELAAFATPASAPASSTSPAPPSTGHAPWLWAALLAGLALMGGMAWTLLRKAKAKPGSAGSDDLNAIDV